MIPADDAVARTMRDTGLDRLAAIRHLQARAALVRSGRWLQRRWA